jgi:hypothetical protein
MTPQLRSRQNLTERGYLVGTVEKKKKFPDRKKRACRACGHQPMIEISSDLWEVFDMVALYPGRVTDLQGNTLGSVIFVQVTSRSNHSTRRNKILASMEAKLCLLSGSRILIQSWGQKHEGGRWDFVDEWITIKDFKQAVSYPSTVAELQEIRRKAKKDDLPPGSTLDFCKGSVDFDTLPF